MATLLLPPGPEAVVPTVVGEATFVLVLSPVPSPEGRLHVERTPLAAGQTVAAALPPGRYQRIIWNGAVLDDEQQTKVQLQAGDEVTAFPRWGEPTTTALLLTFAIGLAVSVATTALTYVLFPPSKPHVEPPDPHTFSFEGIRTAIGPGSIKPVIYGRHRIGGQLLSASVDQAQTILDTGAVVTRLTAIDTPPTLTMLIALGEGPINNVLMDTIELNGQPLVNFPGVQAFTRLGTASQTPIAEVGETRNTFADGRDLPDNSSNTGIEIVYTTTAPVTAFLVNVVFNQGLFHMNGKGEKEDNLVNIAYRFKQHGTPTWTGYSVFQVNAQRTAPVRFAIRRENLPQAVYDIGINFGGIRHNDDLRSKWQPTLESVTEVVAGAQAYPFTALLGLRAVATDQLQGALPNLTVEIQGRTVRQGTFALAEDWTDNPAWCVMDLMTNSRYGMGIPDSEIDLAAFQVWANYCNDAIGGEARHTCNYVLEREGRSQALLMEMMGGSRTLMLKSEGLWSPRPTRDDPPGPLLSWATCSNLRVTYTRDPERVNVMEARFANEEDGYQQDVLVWPTVEDWPAEVHKASLEIRTVTKPSRIMRALQFELNRRTYENCIIEFDNALDAVTMQPHDLFRFSHPLPGWGASGRIAPGSTQTTVILDHEVTLQAGVTYQLYLTYIHDFTEARIVFNPGDTTTRTLQFGVPFSFAPQPYDTRWAFGTASPEGAIRVFRAVKVERKSDTTCHIQAVIHQAAIYNEPSAIPVPATPGLFNPLGPPPPLTTLIATELTRIQASGASLRVVNLAWDVAGLAPGFAPYGGAKIFRRTLLLTGTAGANFAGGFDLGAITNPNDPNVNFVQLTQVTGHVLELDDFSVVTNNTYLYRVVPVSGRGVPNNAGALDAYVHVAGPTTPDFFPGTPRNLRLVGKAVGVTTFEGRDVHIQWDTVADSPLFSETFFVSNYVVQVWAPFQAYLLRNTATGGVQSFTYTFSMNQEDHINAGIAGAQRALWFYVYAVTNTGRFSLDPAVLAVQNPPPDMSNILPQTVGLFEVAIIQWDQFVEPIDFDHYEVHLDIVNPPVLTYQDIAISFHGVGSSFRKVFPQGLAVGVRYYTFILPYDTFGPGLASQIASFIPASLTADKLDEEPPDTPTGLSLTTGTEVSDDGTILTWVEASWTLAPEPDVARYEVHVFVGTNPAPTVWNPQRAQTTIRFYVPGRTLIRVKLLASDRFANNSDFTAEATITSAGDTLAPGPPSNLTTFSSLKAVVLFWTPPADADYDYSEVWSALTNNRANAIQVGTARNTFVHEGLIANDTRFYWVRAVDTSGNTSAFFPALATAGVSGTAGQIDTTYISSLAADKIIAGTIQAFVTIGVANRIFLDGLNQWILVSDQNGIPRAQMGKLGNLSTEWGLRLFNAAGQTMWNFTDGAQTAGISDAAITAAKISAATITSTHLRTDTAVITTAAQIANAIIGDAKITNLSATKVISGVFLGQYFLGATGRIQMDGVNDGFAVYDGNNVLRVLLGHTLPGPEGYGLNIWNSLGQIMWSFSSGASSLGIQDLAVTRAKIDFAAIGRAQIGDLEVDNAKIENLTLGTGKIQPNAITERLIFDGSGGGNSSSTETIYAGITFPVLNPGDQVMLIGKCNAHGAGAGGIATSLLLRQDGVGGFLHDVSTTGVNVETGTATVDAALMVEGVYTVGSVLFGKAFALTTIGNGTVSDVHLIGLLLKK